MNTKVVYSVILAIAIAALLVYIFILRNQQTQQSPTVQSTQNRQQTQSQQPFVVNTYTLTQPGNIVIPLLSENFVISAAPYNTDSASIALWFNISDDIKLHDDSLVINETPITITQETPILYSGVLEQNNVPYKGYPYLVIASNAPLLIKAAFYVG